jgi:hypothetical protein
LLRQLLIGTLDVAVAVSIHDRVIKIIHWHNPSCKRIALVESASKRIKYQAYQKR